MARRRLGNTQLLQVWVTPETHARLSALAQARNTTIAALVRQELPTLIALIGSKEVSTAA